MPTSRPLSEPSTSAFPGRIERYDPLAGWLFHSRHRPRVSGTAATVSFLPPFVGRWRVMGEYEGRHIDAGAMRIQPGCIRTRTE